MTPMHQVTPHIRQNTNLSATSHELGTIFIITYS